MANNEMWENCLSILRKHRVIAVIRADSWYIAEKMAETSINAGVRLIEVTWNSINPAPFTAYLRQKYPHCYIGVGTVINLADLKTALDAGAQFVFCPHFDQDLLNFAHNRQIPLIPGTFSPSEIINAFRGGALVVKVFPIQCLGGVNYIKALQGPMSQYPLIPTGGVTMAQTPAFLDAGALAVGLASDLFPPHLVLEEKWTVMGAVIAENLTKINEQLTIDN